MVFSSIEFLFLFLPVFLITYSLFSNNFVLLIFSLFFYFVGEDWFTGVLLASIGFNYICGLFIGDSPGRIANWWLAAGLAANILLLIVMKYAGLLAETFTSVTETHWTRQIHLPLGISFFTFHSMSYLIDIWRQKADGERSLLNLATYISMFPQLVAGPIVRYHTISRQLVRRVVTYRNIYYGCFYFAVGLAQKVLVADTLASVADPLFGNWANLSMAATWLAVIAYSFQIFFDFGGYSNMAIGLAFLIGFQFPMNFNKPYTSQSITEFWRRWHMSLSAWFRDYLYIPLGGNRKGAFRTYVNLCTVFVICGLWHGAAWTFLFWGAYHGALLVIERLGLGRMLERMPHLVRHCYALLAIIIGWIFFRADSMQQGWGMLGRIFGFTPTGEISIYLT